jgi:hypothetical protein
MQFKEGGSHGPSRRPAFLATREHNLGSRDPLGRLCRLRARRIGLRRGLMARPLTGSPGQFARLNVPLVCKRHKVVSRRIHISQLRRLSSGRGHLHLGCRWKPLRRYRIRRPCWNYRVRSLREAALVRRGCFVIPPGASHFTGSGVERAKQLRCSHAPGLLCFQARFRKSRPGRASGVQF